MEPTTQSPTQNPPETQPDQGESRNKPLPSTERDFRRPARTASPGFRIAIIIGIVVLLVVGFFVYRYVTSYEDTDDAQVDGYINSISARITGHVDQAGRPGLSVCATGNRFGRTGSSRLSGCL